MLEVDRLASNTGGARGPRCNEAQMRRSCAKVPGADSVALMRLSRAISEREGVSGSTLPDPASRRGRTKAAEARLS